MKKVLIALLFFPALVMAKPTEVCVKEHLAAAKLNPGIGYEKNIEIVRVWCECKWQQEQAGRSETEAIEYCVIDTLNAGNTQERHNK